MYSEAVVEGYADSCEMVGFCDANEGRLKQRVEWAREKGAQATGYLAPDFEKMIAERTAARSQKDWAKADEIRARLKEMGVVLEDGPGGTSWRLDV